MSGTGSNEVGDGVVTEAGVEDERVAVLVTGLPPLRRSAPLAPQHGVVAGTVGACSLLIAPGSLGFSAEQ
jgi:hypothetical protein